MTSFTAGTYTWKDSAYREFMMEVLRNLEPRFAKQGSTLVEELDCNDEIIFCYKGEIFFGYELNKQRHFCIKYQNGCVIGAYGCTYNQRSNHIVYANSNSDCQFIRKTNWKKILDIDEQIAKNFKRKILSDHLNKVHFKIELDKKRKIIKVLQREDYQGLQVLQPKQDSNMMKFIKDMEDQ